MFLSSTKATKKLPLEEPIEFEPSDGKGGWGGVPQGLG